MTKNIIWLHDKALSHHNLNITDESHKAIFIWDDNYFKNRAYSLKRLVFIYETLCEMNIEIIKGDILEILESLNPDNLITYFTADSVIKEITAKIAKNYNIEIIKPRDFVKISDGYEFTRFFKYWNKAKNTAFLKNAGEDA